MFESLCTGHTNIRINQFVSAIKILKSFVMSSFAEVTHLTFQTSARHCYTTYSAVPT